MAFPPSALDARTQTFPTLTAAQIDRIQPCGKVRKVDRGEVLFKPNDSDMPFFVLLSGELEIVQPEVVAKLETWMKTLPKDVEIIQAPRVLAGAIGKIAERRLQRGEATDPALLDANYVRRSDAELFWKEA